MSIFKITTQRGLTYDRYAWTGGDKPDIDFARDPEAVPQEQIEAIANGSEVAK